ncbi:hypothetical protein [Acinetobacter modestus]|uniref:hypothetical protein n=1 Tax=Acinetobacter modestus TaxID=1776740 RepID=UPI0030165FB3
MFNTKYGPFDGKTWEDLCQMIFKRKYEKESYQKIPASPGDFGLEGFTLSSGLAFQCYCPEKHYDRKELYEKQRDKITADLNKLKDYEEDIAARLGETKICKWIFVTPEFDKNELIKHARKKEEEIRGWKLGCLTDDFTVLLYDADDYALEIRDFQTALGEVMYFSDILPLVELNEPKEVYEKNIVRKNKLRLKEFENKDTYERKLAKLNDFNIDQFLSCDPYLKSIEAASPTFYMKLLRVITEFESTIKEETITWFGDPQDLTEKLRKLFIERIINDLKPNSNITMAAKISEKMFARWLAVCELDYDC